MVLNPGQYLILTGTTLQIAQVTTSVSVVYTPEEVALEQVKIEETQRVFGVIPNFYVVYDAHPAPLTTKLKFHLALKTSTDAFTVLGVGTLAAINQAGGTPGYVQGWKGYGERFGAVAADGFSDIMIGAPSCPRCCARTPATTTRGRGQISLAFCTPSPARSSAGETTDSCSPTTQASVATWARLLSPTSTTRHRTAVGGLVFQNFFISTGERMLSGLVQEFVLNRVTLKQKAKNQSPGTQQAAQEASRGGG